MKADPLRNKFLFLLLVQRCESSVVVAVFYLLLPHLFSNARELAQPLVFLVKRVLEALDFCLLFFLFFQLKLVDSVAHGLVLAVSFVCSQLQQAVVQGLAAALLLLESAQPLLHLL